MKNIEDVHTTLSGDKIVEFRLNNGTCCTLDWTDKELLLEAPLLYDGETAVMKIHLPVNELKEILQYYEKFDKATP